MNYTCTMFETDLLSVYFTLEYNELNALFRITMENAELLKILKDFTQILQILKI